MPDGKKNWGMKMDKDREDAALDALFSAGQADALKASDDFLARLTADAEAALPRPMPVTPTPAPFLGGLRGWFAASGLSGAAVLGVWIGFVMPDAISEFTTLTDETVGLYTFLPGADLSDLSQQRHPGRERDDEITIFKNGGGGHLDLMCARLLHQHYQQALQTK